MAFAHSLTVGNIDISCCFLPLTPQGVSPYRHHAPVFPQERDLGVHLLSIEGMDIYSLNSFCAKQGPVIIMDSDDRVVHMVPIHMGYALPWLART